MTEQKVAEFEMTSSTGREAYARLVNRPGITVVKENDFFSTMVAGPDEPGFALIIRIVDYFDREVDEKPVYEKPIS